MSAPASTAPDELDATLNAEDIREHVVNEMRDRVLAAGLRMHFAGIALGKATYDPMADRDAHREASSADIAAERAFAAVVVDVFATLKQALHDHDVPVITERA
jgi:hypothetical protein